MLKSIIAGSSIIAFLIISDVSNAQTRNIAPYIGASGSLGSIDNTDFYGWGIEAGLRFFSFYAGLEGGAYSPVPYTHTTDPIIGQTPAPFAISGQFWGLHAGYVFRDFTYLGIVVLKSYEMWETPTSEFIGYSSTRNYFDFGPDFRYSGLADGHLYLALALTYRRGLKAGLGYMF